MARMNRLLLTLAAGALAAGGDAAAQQLNPVGVYADETLGADTTQVDEGEVLTVCMFPKSMTAEILERTSGPAPGDS